MSDEYTRDHRHDFLTTLGETREWLSDIGVRLSNQVFQATSNMDLITEEDAAEMRSRLEATKELFDSWDNGAFSWRKP